MQKIKATPQPHTNDKRRFKFLHYPRNPTHLRVEFRGRVEEGLAVQDLGSVSACVVVVAVEGWGECSRPFRARSASVAL